jgi:hypothetical protein
MMQIVEQMMTSLSLYALLHIKLNIYIKINIYWKKKLHSNKKYFQDILYIILLISLIRISTVFFKRKLWLITSLNSHDGATKQTMKAWTTPSTHCIVFVAIIWINFQFMFLHLTKILPRFWSIRILRMVFVLENLPIKMLYFAHVSHIFGLTCPLKSPIWKPLSIPS